MHEFTVLSSNGPRVSGSALFGRTIASRIYPLGQTGERVRDISEYDQPMGAWRKINSHGRRLARFALNRETAARAVTNVGLGVVAAAIGIILSPDFAFAAPIQDLETPATLGKNLMKWGGYTAATVGIGGACIAKICHSGLPVIGTFGTLGVCGAGAVGSERIAQQGYGAAQAADLSVFLPGGMF